VVEDHDAHDIADADAVGTGVPSRAIASGPSLVSGWPLAAPDQVGRDSMRAPGSGSMVDVEKPAGETDFGIIAGRTEARCQRRAALD
jgi:hypothetical protein